MMEKKTGIHTENEKPEEIAGAHAEGGEPEEKSRSFRTAEDCASSEKIQISELKEESERLRGENRQIPALKEELERLRGENEQLRALETIYSERLETVEKIHRMKFARAYAAVSTKTGKGDPFDSVRRNLRNHEWIHLWIGLRSYMKEAVRVEGWAAAPHDPAEYLRVVDREHRIVKCPIIRKNRPEVNSTWEISDGRRTGFVISISNEDLERRPLYLQAECAHGMLTVPLELEPDREKRIRVWEQKKERKERSTDGPAIDYDDWAYLKKRERGRHSAEQAGTESTFEPLVSIIVPLYNTPLPYLEELLSCVLSQTYRKTEVCLADGSTEDGPGESIRKHFGTDRRIRYLRLPENLGISGNTNAAIGLSRGEFLVFADHDDLMEEDAVSEIVRAFGEDPERTDLVYTDEDKVTADGKVLFDPFFKPDFDRDLLESYNYFTHIVAVRKSTAESAGLLRSGYDGAQDYDFVLRVSERARKIVHIPEALYHWRAYDLSTAGNPDSKAYAYENGRRALEDHLRRTGAKAKAEMTPYLGRYRSVYLCERVPSVEHIAVPGKDAEGTAAILNAAAERSGSEYLLFLREGAEAVHPDFESVMAGLLEQRKEIGVVGTRVAGRNGRLAGAGYILGTDGLAAPAFADMASDVFTYGGYANVRRSVSGVGVDCMMVRRKEFLEAGMFDPGYKKSLFDLDFCLTMRQRGLKTVMEPYAEIVLPLNETAYSAEHFAAGPDRKRFLGKWQSLIDAGDPYFNVNLDKKRVDFSFDGQYI